MDWRDIEVAGDGTHHLLEGHPIYVERYDEVLKFHAPGLAPVRTGDCAWHIDTAGRAAYERRFARTFGFYEERAAVTSAEGWHHIHVDGADLYSERYSWCGNYQAGLVTVRTVEGEYLHLNRAGRPLYAMRWRYAGDYRDATAVVQRADGRSTHIDLTGALVHGRWFLDLDVFHKGFARARDADGWMHIDRSGQPVYARRFANVEPFYNGQARVERLDGALEVIGEAGQTIVEIRRPQRDEFDALSGDLVGYWRTQAARAAVELGVFDALPNTSTAIAESVGGDLNRTARLLRALGELRLVEFDGFRWTASARGVFLRGNHPESLAVAAREYGDRLGARWGTLSQAIRDSSWRPRDLFEEVASDAHRVAGHHQMLRSYALHDYPAVADALDLEGVRLVIDAAGGLGVLSALVLRRNPALRAVLLERPEVAKLAAVAEPLRDRFDVRAGDLFAPWNLEADAVLLARVLHDWDDAQAVAILRRARATLPVGRRVFIVEMVLEEDRYAGGLCDLHLLVSTGGRERTAREFGELLIQGGFALEKVLPVAALPSIVVGVAR